MAYILSTCPVYQSYTTEHFYHDEARQPMAQSPGLPGLLIKKKQFQYAQSDCNAIPKDEPTHEDCQD